METGTLQVLERAKNDPMLIFTEVYGIGSKKAYELLKLIKLPLLRNLEQDKMNYLMISRKSV